jgi:imidazolonepropionase-like amidohydrolase
MLKRLFINLLLVCIGADLYAQATFPLNGVQDQRLQTYLFKNATIHVDAKTVLTNSWLLIQNGKIAKVGKDFDYPKNAIVQDLDGKHIYPAFIDVFSDYGTPEIPRTRGGGFGETRFESPKEGAYAWNQAVKPEIKASDIFKVNAKTSEELRKAGFGAVVTHSQDGIIRGTSAFVSLNAGKENEIILKNEVASHFSFDKGSSIQTYPVSLMGSVALLRQTFFDAEWYSKGGKEKERNLSLESFSKNLSLPLVFHSRNVLDVLRADQVGKELGVQFIIKSNGDEYQKIDEIVASKASLIVPVNFPKPFDVEDPLDAERVTLSELKHWELAPANLAKLAQNNVSFAITTSGLIDKSQFLANVQKAIENGLDKSKALAALTSEPAKFLKLEDQVGTLKAGLLANFLITSGDIFDAKTKIAENWIQGNQFVINDLNVSDIKGKYKLEIDGNSKLAMDITGENDKPAIEVIKNDTVKIKTTTTRDKDFLTINFKMSPSDKGVIRLSGYIDDKGIRGEGRNAEGKEITWRAISPEKSTKTEKADTTKKADKVNAGKILFPFTAYGNLEKPKSEDLLIKNATVWTNEKDGIVTNADVLVKGGKIAQVGKNIAAGAGIKVVDGTNKHVTTGIIDEHSHIALFSINEVETVSSEVRQGDVIDSEDIDIYRQLAGGVTTSQLLHGSADCIGGQSAIIKLKWGEAPEKLKIPNAPQFIKFALGENVKRGSSATRPNRFPATRMGVEQVYFDAFQRAKEYKKEHEAYAKLKSKAGVTAPRRDLELEALVEILDEKRFITCHSYVQSEINMLMHVADSMGFKINTFTHILEGYKVADKMKERSINGSTFSDWWAYKMEVKEAIPYNAAIMTKVGINTAINSDDAEMARRLNQEAAKTILYGGLTPEEAWKTVTLNPAKMLRLDAKLGSIKAGKDADLVIWNENPLSIYAKPEKTIIEGAVYFDAEQDKVKGESVAEERNRIIQKMLEEKNKGAATVRPNTRVRPSEVHCDSMLEFGGITVEEFENQQLLNNHKH